MARTIDTASTTSSDGHGKWDMIRAAHQKQQLLAEDSTSGGLPFERRDLKDLGGLMGRVVRSAITGEVHLKASPAQRQHGDFLVVDLWTRPKPGFKSRVDRLMDDKYLFKPVPLLYRTWIYHYLYNSGKVVSSSEGASDSDGMIKHVLNHKCIDMPMVGAGRWCPGMVYVPISLAACLTNDYLVMGVTAGLMMFLFGVSWCSNDPDTYRYARLGTTGIRVAYALWLISWLASGDMEDLFSLLGWMLTFVLCLAELVLGDGAMAVNYWMHCQYEVVRSLPNRVFVCRRTGAAGTQLPSAHTSKIDECVTGMGRWDGTMALIMDLQGLLVELHPMRKDDWDNLSELYREKLTPTLYVGVDAYNEYYPKPVNGGDFEETFNQSPEKSGKTAWE